MTLEHYSGVWVNLSDFIAQKSTSQCTVVAKAISWFLQFVTRHSTVTRLVCDTAQFDEALRPYNMTGSEIVLRKEERLHAIYYCSFRVASILRLDVLHIASLIRDQQYLLQICILERV